MMIVAAQSARWPAPPTDAHVYKLYYGTLWNLPLYESGGLRIMPLQMQDSNTQIAWSHIFKETPEETRYWEVWWSTKHTTISLIRKLRPKARLQLRTLKRTEALLSLDSLLETLQPLEPVTITELMTSKKN